VHPTTVPRRSRPWRSAASGTELNVEFRVRDRDGKDAGCCLATAVVDGEVPSTHPLVHPELLVILWSLWMLSEGDIMSKQLMLLNRLAKTTRFLPWSRCALLPANANAQIRLCGWRHPEAFHRAIRATRLSNGIFADDAAGPAQHSNYVINVDLLVRGTSIGSRLHACDA